MSHSERYDLYLMRGCRRLPSFDHLERDIPAVTYPAFQQWIVTKQPTHLGFLHLDLDREHAETLLRCLQATGARGSVIKAVYRHPKIVLS